MISDEHTLDRILSDGLTNLCQSFVDDLVRENAALHSDAGLRSKVIRIQTRPCCDWCANLSGTYDYEAVPSEVWQRHDNCDCRVIFQSEKGYFQDAHTKDKYDSMSDAKAQRINESTAREKRRKQAKKDADARRKAQIEQTGQADIRSDYLKESTPNKGSFKVTGSEKEIAEKLHRELGGDFESVNKSVFSWRGKRWTSISAKTPTEVDELVKGALSRRTGGLVLDLRAVDNRTRSMILENFVASMKKNQSINMDVVVIDDKSVRTIVRFYKK